ncbi:MAG: hypothetical protein WBA23_16550 [Tunicatimonas sp.]|uniref:hypothetical protein n=1 Tax=Tunicatimonas sp. TaxID=1940096 RepID=UPI003C76496F
MTRLSLLTFSLSLLFFAAEAQVSFDLQYGASRQDYSNTTFRLNYQINDTWRIGGEFQGSDYRYRFIDARKIENGFASETRLFVLGRLAENDLIRLDFFAKAGWRSVVASDETQEVNYAFENSGAVIFDPGLLVTIKASEKFFWHTGVRLPITYQVNPEPLAEQLQSSYIMLGGSYSLGERWALLANGSTGATFGAGGDTEKYMWRIDAGLRFSLFNDAKQNLITGY